MPQNIIKRGNDVYIHSNGEWFVYDCTSVPLGQGAMGTVYLGIQCSSKQHVAIKKVLDQYANVPSIRERAKLEASLAFRHHNLVEMLGYCELNPHYGPIYIISKYVHGVNSDVFVNSKLRNLPDASKRICEMFYPVLDALEYIHSKNIVHLDIKPSNIMVENGCNTRLMDLGIAFISEKIDISQSGVMGTPRYAAPEQFISHNSNVDALSKATDIYEAGLTLYELLVGNNPFAKGTFQEIKKLHATLVLPPSPTITKKLLKVLRTATAVDSKMRYQNAREFKIALQNALRPGTSKKLLFATILSAILIVVLIIFVWIL